MKVSVLILFVLSVYCLSVDCWRRRRSSRWIRLPGPTFPIRRGSSGTFGSPGGTGPFGGTNIRKRSVQKMGNLYNITLQVDPCNFYTYDDDRNGAIFLDEMHAMFGNNGNTDALFEDLDTTGDEVIEEGEFYEKAPVTIHACLEDDEE